MTWRPMKPGRRDRWWRQLRAQHKHGRGWYQAHAVGDQRDGWGMQREAKRTHEAIHRMRRRAIGGAAGIASRMANGIDARDDGEGIRPRHARAGAKLRHQCQQHC